MFGRNTPPSRQPDSAHNAPLAPSAPTPLAAAQPQAATPASTAHTSSVIGTDLAIIGQKINIVSQSVVRIDGIIEGNIDGREVIVGESGQVNGSITANSIEIRGTVHGSINAESVALLQTAQVDGDVNHQTLTIAEGARFDGRVRRPEDPSVLQPNLDVAALTQAIKSQA